jgi:outer membrane protein TolC
MLTAGALRADDNGILLLDEVVSSTVARAPAILAQAEDQAAAEGELLSARGAFDPVLKSKLLGEPFGYYRSLAVDTWLEAPTPLWGTTFFAGYRYFTGSVPVYEGKLVTGSGGELRAGLLVPLLRNGPIDRRRAGQRRAELGRTLADLGYQQQLLELVRTASHRYWDWVAAGRRLAIQEALAALAIQRDSALAGRVKRGDLPAIERTDNQRAIVQRQAAVVQARRAVEQAAIELGIFVRAEDGAAREPAPRELPSSLPEPFAIEDTQVTALVGRAAERRPEAQRVEVQRKQAEVELKVARNQLWPGLDLTAQISQDFGEVREPAKGSAEIEGGVVFDLPIPNRAAFGRIRATEALVRRAGRQAQQARDRISADVRDALSAMRAARERVTVTRQELSLARELERAERQRFDLGDSTLLLVNIREQQATEAALREIDATADFHKAHASFRFATAATLDDFPAQVR